MSQRQLRGTARARGEEAVGKLQHRTQVKPREAGLMEASVTGHAVFLRRSHSSSRRDLSNWSAFEVHRDVKERDRILTCVGTGSIPERGKAS